VAHERIRCRHLTIGSVNELPWWSYDQYRFIQIRTAILRRLGEELNPTMDQGVLELVKNSYDADAISCTVTLQTSRPSVERSKSSTTALV